jgi:6-phospho-beta-glucosidase
MGVKVAVVGAGSTYTPELVEGFARRTDRFPMDALALLDIDPERLGIVGALADRMLRKAGWPGRLTLTGDRAEALEGADFVIVQLRVGGQAARLLDETIPLRFGCIGQETTGPGGFAKALRTVPLVLELAEETARRGAPGVWFVDFTNPVGLVTQALLDAGHRALGLCNVAIGFQREFAKLFGVESTDCPSCSRPPRTPTRLPPTVSTSRSPERRCRPRSSGCSARSHPTTSATTT